MLKRLGEQTINPSVKIKDANFPSPFVSGLEYGAPARGTWNIVHVGMMIPEAHQIFACAQGCLRGVVLTAAEMGASDRFSTIAVRENNVLDGDMEDLIIDGVADILERLPKYPPAVLLYTSCIHHFMGSDLDYVYKVLRDKYPQIQFTDCYMNPIMRKSGMTPDQTMRRQLYSLLKNNTDDFENQNSRYKEKEQKEYIDNENSTEKSKEVQENRRNKKPVSRRIHLAGGDFSLDANSELHQLLTGSGYEVCQISACRSYEEYQELAACGYAITTFPAAKAAGEYLEKKYRQKHIYLPASFSYDVIENNLIRLQQALNLENIVISKKADQDINGHDGMKDAISDSNTDEGCIKHILEAKQTTCDKALEALKGLIGDIEIAIDFTAFPFILSLAKLLITKGFRVTRLYTDSFPGEEKACFLWLKEHAPNLEIYPTVHTSMRVMPRKRDQKVLAIGQKAAYFEGTDFFVNVVEGGGYWGYEAILRLVELMWDAYNNPKDTKSLIQIKGMGCGTCI